MGMGNNSLDGALDIASALCDPTKKNFFHLMKKGIGSILVTSGGAGLIYGIVILITNGLTASALVGGFSFFGLTTIGGSTVISTIWTGPVSLGLGISSFVLGIWFLAQKSSTKNRAITALNLIRKAVTNWANEDYIALSYIKNKTESPFSKENLDIKDKVK